MKGGEVLQIRVLGQPAVLRHRTRVQLPPSKKTRALLAYLAVTARPHSRDRLCSMFWAVPDDPRAALRWSLSHLRPIVDEHDCQRIIADRENVGLDPNGIVVDLLSLRSLVRNGAESISTDELRQAAEVLEGDFLEGLDLPDCHEFQNWCTGQREETRPLRAQLLTALIARLESAPEEALRYARALSLLEPADEKAHAILVRLLRTAGRWREAEEQFQRAQQRLDEFNVVCTGTLRQAVQVPIRSGGPTIANNGNAHDGNAISPHAEPLHRPPASHEVKFCRTSDGVRIAYAAVGDGPPLVWAAHCLSHLGFNCKNPVWRHWIEEFAKDHCFVHYDERGNGLSDWDNSEFSIDACVRDLEAVVDAAGIERFALVGSLKSGPPAIVYAVRHPKRVSHLILHGTFAQGWRQRGNADTIERTKAMVTLTRQGWAQDNPAFRQILTSLLLPDATLEEMGWLNELQRMSSSPENAARLLDAIGDFNVLDILPDVTAPTLVLHSRDDATVPFDQGRLIASRIPGAKFVSLDSRNHILLPRDPAWTHLVSEVRQFLGEGERTTSGPQPMGAAAGRAV
jgi:DNA-binding SARP family transcriptional activator/pimeloyl-ACP methyl ester carboxylesterase